MGRKRKITMVSKEGATGSSSNTQGSAGGAPPSGQDAPSTEGTRQPIPTEKKVRRHTRMEHIWKMPENAIVVVQLNDDNCPIGPEATAYAQFLGTVARHPIYCPIDAHDWRKLPDHFKDNIWEDIIVPRFKFVPEERALGMKEYTLKEINTKWKTFKYNLRSLKFKPDESEDWNVAKLANEKPKRVDADQYRKLVKYWMSDEGKKDSETNKTCRGYHKDPHNGGSMPLRILAEKMAKENDGVRPCRGDLYVATHKDKDGNYINDASQEYGTQMEKIMNEERSKRELQQLENPDLIFEIDVDWDNDEYAQVKGKPKKGRVNAKGHLPKEVIKGNKKSTTNQGSSHAEMAVKIKEQAEKIEQIEQKHSEEREKQDAKIDQQQALLDQQQAKLEKLESFFEQHGHSIF